VKENIFKSVGKEENNEFQEKVLKLGSNFTRNNKNPS